MRTIRLALRLLRRDWRAGELRVLVAALVLAVGSVGTVGFFADRVKSALTTQANLLLGADLMISGDRALPPAFDATARARGLATTPVIRFNSMVPPPATAPVDAAAVLTDVKAVGAGYPLRGAVVLADPARPDGTVASGIPGRGEAWPDQRLADRLGVKIGDRISVGESTLTVTAIVQQEPEVAGIVFALGPKLLLNVDDVPATNLLQPGNRATWRLLVADTASAGALDAYRTWLGNELRPGQRMETVRDLRPEVRQTLERAEKFLGLAALVAVLLAAVAVALAASRYLRRHLDAAAMFRCFGARVGQTLALFFVQFLVLGVLACTLGVLVALAGQQLLVSLMASVVASELPSPTWVPAATSFATGVLLLLGFALPPLVALASVPPLRVLRRDLPRPRAGGVLAYALGAATVALLIGFQAREVQAGLIMVGGVAGLLLASALVAWVLLALLKRLPQRGVTWRFGLANLRRRAFASSLQIGALALGLMALLLLTVVRGDLMRNWRASLPPDAPNQFLINVLPDQVADARAQLAANVGADVAFRPMVRGRLVAINGAEVDTKKYTDTRARRLAEREFNLSWADTLPKGNQIARGTFWAAGMRAEDAGMSLEEGIADTLGVSLGDALTFDIAGSRVAAKVTSLRKVDWDSFRVNFFALFPPGPLEAMPATYIAAFRAPEGNGGWLPALVQKHPNILAIDIGEIVRQVQGIMDHVSRAVEFVFLFTLAGGLLVLQAAIAATQDERKFDAAILRTLGASRRQLRAAQVAEFLLLGALAGIVAAAGAIATGWALADRVFRIPFEANPMVVVYGVLGGAVAVTLAGWLGTRATTRLPPLAVIRQLG
ncbi:MAG: FtsX-like permease family protein [Betaproteobacteria bacterium]|nr:FtsX-like permease family protein [Betaproteobacteria bacterium]